MEHPTEIIGCCANILCIKADENNTQKQQGRVYIIYLPADHGTFQSFKVADMLACKYQISVYKIIKSIHKVTYSGI